MKQRCTWATEPLYWEYHDREWGVPVHQDQRLFEFLVLEGAQAGLSWSTILRKRETYRAAFRDFEIAKVARFGARDVQRLLNDPGIVRNRLKVASAIQNARAVLRIAEEFGSLDAYLWQFVGGTPIQHAPRSLREVPTRTAVSDAMSKALQGRGLSFVGSTICYAFMQAVGMVNDHAVDCFRFRQLGGRISAARSKAPATRQEATRTR